MRHNAQQHSDTAVLRETTTEQQLASALLTDISDSNAEELVNTVDTDTEQSTDADALLLRPLPIGHRLAVHRAEKRVYVVTVYESAQSAKDRAQRIWFDEYNTLLLAVYDGKQLDAAQVKRVRKLETLLDIPNADTDTAEEHAITEQHERELAAQFMTDETVLDATVELIPIEVQYAVARGKYAEFEDALIAQIDAQRSN